MSNPRSDLDTLARARIVKWRQRARMTQKQLADAIGRNSVWVSRYENGYFNADLDTLSKLATAFNQNIYALLDLKVDPIEQEIIDCIRQIARPAAREMALALLRELAGENVAASARAPVEPPTPPRAKANGSRQAKPAGRRV